MPVGGFAIIYGDTGMVVAGYERPEVIERGTTKRIGFRKSKN